jgi:hypothetical protein
MIEVRNQFARPLEVETVCSRNAVIVEIRDQHARQNVITVFISMDDVRAFAAIATSSPDNGEVARMLNLAFKLLVPGRAELVDLPDIPPSTPPLPDIPSGWTG